MKITIEHEGVKVMVDDESVVDICDALDLAEKAFMKIGYQKRRIHGGFITKAKLIEASDEIHERGR